MLTILSAIFSGLWNAILSKFGMSIDRKLGRAEIQNAENTSVIKGEQDAKKIDDAVDNQPSDVADNWLHRK